MMNNSENINGLKGQNIIAQGRVSEGTTRNAAVRLRLRRELSRSLGKECRRKTVHGVSINKANISFWTELSDIILGK